MGALIHEDLVPIKPKLLGESRLSRELGKDIYVVAFPSKRKAETLAPLSMPGYPANAEVLTLLTGRENAHCYYAAAPLECSPSARAILLGSTSLNQAYARMPLIATPSQFIDWCGLMDLVVIEEDVQSEANVDLSDGQAEIGLELAKAFGLFRTTLTEMDISEEQSSNTVMDEGPETCRVALICWHSCASQYVCLFFDYQ